MKKKKTHEHLQIKQSEENEENATTMYKYSLDKSSKKFRCPSCGKKRFVKYINNESGEYLPTEVGRCDREVNCSYHLSPKDYLGTSHDSSRYQKKTKSNYSSHNQNKPKADYHDIEKIKKSFETNSKNQFIEFLTSKFDTSRALETIKKYKIGTAEFNKNETIFWQIDSLNRVRGGKMIEYNTQGKRSKYINWYHSYLIKSGSIKQYNLKQCFFGEHLLNSQQKPIAIVESEKTACIMDIVFDKYTWMAAGSLRGLSYDKLIPLKNHKIILYPDLGIKTKFGSPFKIWEDKCKELEIHGFDISISRLLEDNSNKFDRQNGLDIADYFIKNQSKKPLKFLSETNRKVLELYMKNKNIKTLIEAFELVDVDGKRIDLS